MNLKRTLALALSVSVLTAAASILAEGSASGPAPDPSDLPTADAYHDNAETSDGASYDTAYLADAYPTDSASYESASTTVIDAYSVPDALAEYEEIAGQWTLSELAAMDAPPVTGDALSDDALAALWGALREALESAPPEQDTEAALSSAAAAFYQASNASTSNGSASGSGNASASNGSASGSGSASASNASAADGPAWTGDAKTDSQLEAEWNAAHPAPEVPEPETQSVSPDDTPEASIVAGPDDGGNRPERELTRQEQRDKQKRDRLTASASEKTEALSKVTFEEIEMRAREDNLTVRAMGESVAGLENMDYDKSAEDLLKVLNGLSAQQDMLSLMPGDSIAASFAISSLQSQYDSLYTTFENLSDGTARRSGQDAINQMTNAMDQIVMGAETLYIALVGMEDQYGALERQLAAVNRTVGELELRYSLGQISALTLNQAKAGRTALVSGMETLSMNIRTYKMQLENMLGASLTGEIQLSGLPEVTENQIAALDADRDFNAAHEKSYELYAAARTLQDAQETFQSSGEQYHYNENNTTYAMARHTWTAAQDTYNVTVRGYELKFRTLYEQVRDYYQVWNASKDALAAQRMEYQSKELQYKQGNISKNALLTAQDSLNEKEEAVRTAANNLFSSYNNYCWAVQTGILN